MTTHPTMTSNTLREEINGLVHLVGCQVYTIKEVPETNKGLKEVERLEKMLSKELLKVISKECNRADRGANYIRIDKNDETMKVIGSDIEMVGDQMVVRLKYAKPLTCKNFCPNTNICKHGYCPPHSYSNKECSESCRK